MTTASDIIKQIADNEIRFVDLRFTDPRGKLHHITMDIAEISEDTFSDGVMFDGSSIAGWKTINESDMVLMPDPKTAHIDPFLLNLLWSYFVISLILSLVSFIVEILVLSPKGLRFI